MRTKISPEKGRAESAWVVASGAGGLALRRCENGSLHLDVQTAIGCHKAVWIIRLRADL